MIPTDGGRGGATRFAEGGAAGEPDHGGGGTVGSTGDCGSCALYPAELPSPCGNDSYVTNISVSGGVGHYNWQVTSTTGSSWKVLPNSNSQDGSLATLSGNPSGAADLTVTVTDGLGYTKQQLYSLTPRTACYFAYVAPDADGPKLALRDPQLDVDATGKLANNAGVYDFEFSPDGRFLAYRYGQSPTHPSGTHLSLLDLSTMLDEALPFDEVTAYAWSPDSSALAVAFTTNDASQLGGMRITPAAGGAKLSFLIPILASNPVESSLLWVDTSFVSFFSTATLDMGAPPSGFSATLYASLGATGFDTPIPITDIFYQPGFVAVAAPGGLFVNSPNDDSSVYNAISTDNARDEDHQTNFVDPAGRFSALIANKVLTLFKASNSSVPFENTGNGPDSDCPKLLTWALGRERIACVAHVSQPTTSWGEIRIFDIGSATPFELAPIGVGGSCLKDAQGVPLAGEQCSQSEYDYDETTSVGQPRLLSNSGKWLAFVTGAQSGSNGYVHWADLSGNPPNLSRKLIALATNVGSPVALAFSASERYLLHQNGNRLVAHLLSAGPSDSGDFDLELNLNAPTAAACAEDFTTGATRWCGGANSTPSFIWSPDPNLDVLAYRKADELIVVELSAHGFNAHAPLTAPVCDATCSGQYAFQPPRP